MKENGHITHLRLKDRQVYFDSESVFALRRDRPYVWLQKACFWVLRKLKAFKVETKVVVESFPIPRGEDIFQSLGVNFSRLRRDEVPTRLIIGAEDWHELNYSPKFMQYTMFHTRYDAGWCNGKTIEHFGARLSVEIVPWMRGYVLLPAPRD